ncbi:MAG: arylsulfotransferase family protein [Solirubrobacteraceae bacterium]
MSVWLATLLASLGAPAAGLTGRAHRPPSGKPPPPPVTISPLPGTPDANPHTQISFLGVPASDISNVTVVGSRSGHHRGALRSYVSAPGASFLPSTPFAEGERVTVSATISSGARRRRVGSSFTIARLFHYRFPPVQHAKPAASSSYASAPGLRAPPLTITTDAPDATPGDIFFGSNEGDYARGPTIVGERGQLVWFHEIPVGDHAMDFKVAQYEGKPVLLWWQGHIPPIGVGFGEDEIYNARYEHIATIHAGNGMHADLHEAQLEPDGSALLTAYTLVQANETSVGGYSDAGLLDATFQQVDVKTGLVMFEWQSYGHVPLTDSYSKPSRKRGWPYDYFHINSISPDPNGDGNLLISSRNTSAGFEINHLNGKVMWELGGKHSSFEMGAGTRTAYQHDIEWQKDGTVTIFDDGASPKVHQQSRALHESIDFETREVKVLSILSHSPPLLAQSQGNYQVLPDGNAFVGWGQEPYFSEYGRRGELLFDAHLPPGSSSYRAYRFPWTGTPSTPPGIAVAGPGKGARTSGTGTPLTVYASWNGATQVASWRVLGGARKSRLAPVASVPLSGFQTEIVLHTRDSWIAVQALSASGEALGTSVTVRR